MLFISQSFVEVDNYLWTTKNARGDCVWCSDVYTEGEFSVVIVIIIKHSCFLEKV